MIQICSRFHGCIPTSTVNKEIDVLLLPLSTAAGSTPSVCAVATVEEHLSCSCGCQNTQCPNPKQRFLPSECRCSCSNQTERAQCIRRPGWYWNSALCQCMCRPSPAHFPRCPSGYRFDAFDSCACVTLIENASTVLEITVLILLATVFLSVMGLFQCYRNRIGFFSKKEEDRERQINRVELRQIFRQISQQTPNSYASWLGYSQIGNVANSNQKQNSNSQKNEEETRLNQ